jgi:hypothetical protein
VTTDPKPALGTLTSESPLPSLLDQISLEAALLDFEVANARVVDLTKRLVEATDDLIRMQHETEVQRLASGGVRREAEALRRETDLLRLEVEAARGSRAYRLAREAHGLIRFLRK